MLLTLRARVGDKGGGFDAGDGADLVVLTDISGDADTTDDFALLVANQHARGAGAPRDPRPQRWPPA
jgi:hypothetical protein